MIWWWLSSASAATWTVAPVGADFTTIQVAVDASVDGDTVLVGPGTYVEAIDLRGKSVAIIGSDGASRTRLAPPAGRVALTWDGGEQGRVEGFTVAPTNARALLVVGSSPTLSDLVIEGGGVAGATDGGALSVTGGAPVLENVRIEGTLGRKGGAIYVTAGATVSLSDVSIDGAEATYGGGLYVDGASVNAARLAITAPLALYSGGGIYLDGADLVAEDLSIVDPEGDRTWGVGIALIDASIVSLVGGEIRGASARSASAGYGGGAIYATGSSRVDAVGFSFADNRAFAGGAVYVTSASMASFEGCAFVGNDASTDGGAIFATTDARVTLVDSRLSGSSAVDGGAAHVTSGAVLDDAGSTWGSNTAYGAGGGLRVERAAASLIGSTFVGNHAATGGGGLSVRQLYGDVSVTSSTFEANATATGDGGGVEVGVASGVRISGGAFLSNEASAGSGGGISVIPGDAAWDVELVDVSFDGNLAAVDGGGLYAVGTGSVEVSGGAWLNNRAGGHGGGAAVESARTTRVERALFGMNAASGDGGGWYEFGTGISTRMEGNRWVHNVADKGGGVAWRSVLDGSLVNNTLVGNTAITEGGHLWAEGASVELVNDIFAFGLGGAGVVMDESSSATARVYYNSVWENVGGDIFGPAVGTLVEGDPSFRSFDNDGDALNDDLGLLSVSPCIDAGDPARTDLDGSRSDIGAYGGDRADLVDADGDGFWSGTDCDDFDPNVFPGAFEERYDGIDQDCDGSDLVDFDRDGFIADVVGGDDCNDNDDSVYPGAPDEPHDGVDTDCDGFSDDDLDHDGFDDVAYGGDDCHDGDPSIHPGADDVPYDGIDADCDGWSDFDADRDGYDAVEFGGDDCDDARPEAHPGADELANDLDDDCDGAVEDFDRDLDGLSDRQEDALGTDPANADTDGDGRSDGEEAPEGVGVDTDDDGRIDALDPDDDGDGLPTDLEDGFDANQDGVPDLDVDGDGLDNSRDTDSDGDGFADAAEGAGDLDGDGIPEVVDYNGDLYGGGCSGGGGSRSMALWGLLPLALWRRRGAWWLLWAPSAAFGAGGSTVPTAGGVDADAFESFGTSPEKWDRLAGARWSDGLGLGLVIDHASRPLVERTPSGDLPILDTLESGVLVAAASSGRLRFEVAAPVHIAMTPGGLRGGMGDLRLGGAYRLSEGAASAVAGGLWVWVPSGDTDRWMGTPGASVAPHVAGEAWFGRLDVVGNLGYRLGAGATTRNLRVGSGPIAGVGARYLLNDRLSIESEWVLGGATGLRRPPMEASIGVKLAPLDGSWTALSFGVGLDDGVGAATWRVRFSGGRMFPFEHEGVPGDPGLPDGGALVDPPDSPPDPDPPGNGLAELRDNRIVIAENVFFREDSDELLPRSLPVLEGVYEVIQAHPEVDHLLVEGHTNDHGPWDYNIELSQRRAEVVMMWLVERGVSRDRLIAKGYGFDKPLVAHDAPLAARINRRVEFTVVRPDEIPEDARVPDGVELPEDE